MKISHFSWTCSFSVSFDFAFSGLYLINHSYLNVNDDKWKEWILLGHTLVYCKCTFRTSEFGHGLFAFA